MTQKKQPLINSAQGTGSVLSPDDYRDQIATAAVAATLSTISLPAQFTADYSKLGVFDQQQQLACMNNTVAMILKRYWFLRTGKIIDFSPRFGDIMCKRFDGLNPATDGAYGRMAFRIAAKYGCATTKTLPNVTGSSILQYRNDGAITHEVLAEAAQYKIPGYIRIPNGINSLRAAVQTYEGISVGYFVGKELWTNENGTFSFAPKDISPLRTPQQINSGHQMILKGWTNENNRLLNSWGIIWGDQGEADANALQWDRFTMEAWAPAEIPNDVQLLLRNLPAPSDFRYYWRNTMRLGEHGEDIKFLQIAYMILGLLAPVKPDELGFYGAKTAAANAQYQRLKRIPNPSPESCGPITRGYLNEDFGV